MRQKGEEWSFDAANALADMLQPGVPWFVVVIQSRGNPSTASGNFKSVKDRLAAQPITLTKLKAVKWDTRTIDEIVQDRVKAKKTLDGDKAREFSDWFGTSEKRIRPRPPLPRLRILRPPRRYRLLLSHWALRVPPLQ